MYSPSFKKELNRLYTVRWIAQQTYGKEHISWTSKMEVRKLVQDLDINLPKIYQQPAELDDLHLPETSGWVLKPVKGAANRGVYPITVKDGKLYNLFTNDYTTWGDIKKEVRKSTGFKPPFYIEQLVDDNNRLPYNWELYCFDGEVGLVRQRENTDRVGKLYKFWDTAYNDLGLIEESKKDILKPELPPPYHPEELLKTASLISKNIPYIFCRVDLFDTPQGVYYGELTMHPGIGNNFTPEIDKQLGQLYLKAEARRT